MDVVLQLADDLILDSLWATLWPARGQGMAMGMGMSKPATPSQSAIANFTSSIPCMNNTLGL